MDKQIQRLTLVLAMIAGLLLHTGETRASHAMGADLTYECLGGNTYRLRVSFYRDCIGISAPGTVYVSIQSASCGQNIGVTCNPIPGTGQEVTPLCPTALSSCNGGIYTGIQEWVYEGIITLPMQCTDWVFSYNLCCRNAAITNISNPASSTFYVYATLNNVISPCNNSPTFSNKPVPFACLGQEFCFNHGAFDVDGDSLVYSLITPFQNAATTVNYNPPFNASNPLTSSPAISFNTATGDICMTPTNLEITVMAVLVSEYRNGVLIGSVERDIQVTVLNCNNNLPTLTGINGTNDFSATVCAGEQLCFFINSADQDATQNVFVNWDNSIPGATFTTSGGNRPTGTFCWTPSVSDISNNPYCFTVRVNDDACPMVGAQVYSYCITVNGINVNAGPDQLIACNDLATLNVNASGGTGNYTYLWSNGVTLPIQTVGTGTYIVTVSDGICSSQDTVEVLNAFDPTAGFIANGSCPNTPIQFTDQSTLPGGIIISWNWNFGGTGTSTIQNPVHTFPAPGTYNVSLVIETNLGCIDTVIQPVVILFPPTAGFNSGSACAGTAITFTNTTTPAGNYNWQWNFGNGQTSGAQNPTITYSNAGTFTVTLIAGDSLGCADTVTQQITILPLPVPSFTNTALLCQGDTINFTDTSLPGGGTITGWNWNFGNGQTSSSQNPSVSFPIAGNYNVSLTITNSLGCSATIVQNIGINVPPVVSAGPNQVICLGGSATLTASGGNTYTWSPGGQTTNPITVSPSTTTTYTVVTTDANGCTSGSSVMVSVNPLPVISVSPNVAICAGQSTVLTATGGTSYNWSPSGNTTGSIVVTPGASTSYAVTGTDANGCSSTNFVTVTVNQLPVVALSNVFICQGATSTMNAGNPGSTYQWSNGQTSQTIVVSNPGTYTVTVTNAFGCSATGSALASQSGTIVNALQNVSFCLGGTATLNAGNPGYNYLWSTGATTQIISVSNPGAYSVTVTDQNGCTGILSTTVNANPLPVANFTPNDICINQPLQFNDISSIATGSIVSWQWNFGDGNVSQQQDPVHNYSSSGTYTVTLVVTSNNGCTDTITRTFNVFPLPQANFSYNFGCVNEPIQFNDMSFTGMGNITGWQWDFNDGTTSNVQNPLHGFPAAGTYNVTLTVTTSGGCVDSRTRNIHIYPIPNLAFTTTQSGTCLGSVMTVNNTSGSSNGAINSWFWDFGDGTTSSAANPVHVYTSPGVYTVTLIGETSHGCSDTISQTFTIYGAPQANAGTDQSICTGNTATLSASGGVSYVWSTGVLTQSVNVSPTSNTTYYVTVTDVNGCTDVDSVRVTVNPVPYVNASPNKNICLGESVSIYGNYQFNVLWLPGGQTTQTITVSPTVTTTYTYNFTSMLGCVGRDSVIVTVNPLPIANAGPDQMICEGTTATLTASGGTSYYWPATGATTQNLYVAPAIPTVYSVMVTNANGCKAYDSVSVGLNPAPVVNFSPAFICVGTSTVLNAGNPGSTYLWSPGGETSQTLSVTDSGYYQVLVTNGFGCVGTGGTNVMLGGTSLVVNPTNINACSGDVVSLDAGNPGANYLWSNGAVTQTITVSTQGVYSVTITDGGGCSASFASNVMINPLPQLQFTPTPTCLGESVLFSNTSSISSGNIINWNWNFGDGSTSNLLQPVHLYTASGNYMVTLTASSGMGCDATITQQVSIDPKPEADFTASIVCAGQQTIFQDASTLSNGVISSWNWNFGDGTSSSTQNPLHNYNAPGVYNATLIVYTMSGCADTITRVVEVLDEPVALFSMQNVCSGTAVQFADGSLINSGSISGYQWTFGDSNSDSIQNPVHMYTAAGTYDVTLVVVSDFGCSATTTQQVTVYPEPVASGTAAPVCDETPVQFNNTSSINGGSISSTYWNFNDGGSSNLISPSHLYAADGNYNVLLTATSDQGCIDSAYIAVTVHPLPVAAFTQNSVCFGQQVQLNDQSTVSAGAIASWNWSFGDGSLSTSQNPIHGYTSPGSYPVQLVVTSDNGCIDSTFATLNVFGQPAAAFAGSNECTGITSVFYNQSTIPGGGVMQCLWDFGDGFTSTAQNPLHNYTDPGVYTVNLVVSSQYGCSDSTSKQITIYNSPVADFTALNACDESPVNFTDLSTSINGIISNWQWNLGDGTQSASANPFHYYAAPGNYIVSLTVTSIFGCTASVTENVNIYSLPEPVISANSNCIYDPVTFNHITAAGDTATYLYSWTFGDGNTSPQSDPTHLYPSAGSYNVSLTMTSANGCVATASVVVDLSPAPDAGFDFSNACANSGVSFTNLSTITSGSIIVYNWDFGDGTAGSNSVNPMHTYDSAGVYTITLIAISDNGCVDTVSQQITVFPLPVSNFLYSQAAGCGPLAIHFTDSSYITSGSITSWNWDFGNGLTSQLQNPSTVYSSSGTYGVLLTVTSNMGCVQTFTQPNIITIYPGPQADFTTDPYEQIISNPVFNFNNLSLGGNLYTWTFGDGSSSNMFEPTHTYQDTGTYEVFLMVQNSYGCTDTITKIVKVIPEFMMYVPNAFTPNSDGVNDYFTVVGIGIENMVLTIFNRWGDPIYTSTDMEAGWNGTIQKSSVTAQQDVYVYMVEVMDVFGLRHNQTGTVTLVR